MADLAPFEITAFTERLIDTGLELTDAEWEADMLQVIVHGVERLNQKLGHPRAVHLATGGVSLGLTLTGGGLAQEGPIGDEHEADQATQYGHLAGDQHGANA